GDGRKVLRVLDQTIRDGTRKVLNVTGTENGHCDSLLRGSRKQFPRILRELIRLRPLRSPFQRGRSHRTGQALNRLNLSQKPFWGIRGEKRIRSLGVDLVNINQVRAK